MLSSRSARLALSAVACTPSMRLMATGRSSRAESRATTTVPYEPEPSARSSTYRCGTSHSSFWLTSHLVCWWACCSCLALAGALVAMRVHLVLAVAVVACVARVFAAAAGAMARDGGGVLVVALVLVAVVAVWGTACGGRALVVDGSAGRGTAARSEAAGGERCRLLFGALPPWSARRPSRGAAAPAMAAAGCMVARSSSLFSSPPSWPTVGCPPPAAAWP